MKKFALTIAALILGVVIAISDTIPSPIGYIILGLGLNCLHGIIDDMG